MSEWCDIASCPPSPEGSRRKHYVLFYNGHHIGVGYHEPDPGDGFGPHYCDESGDFIEPSPTHWMPLPPPPR